MSWSQKHAMCIKCESTFFSHKGHGLCRKCYEFKKRIEKLKNLSKEEYGRYIVELLPSDDWTETQNKSKEEIVDIIAPLKEDKELRWLKMYGRIQNNTENLDVVKLEIIMNEIARNLGKREGFYTLDLLVFDTRFTKGQRKILALKLLKMLIK